MLQEQINKISQDIDNKENFTTVFQPKVSMDGKNICSVETLVRSEHGSPHYFIPEVEKLGKISALTDIVLDNVASALRVTRFKKDMVFAVNLSPEEISQENFIHRITKWKDVNSINTKRIEFEITETASIGFNSEMIEKLYKLKEFGFKISMDDFGAGFSSVARLDELPVDVVKLDKVFTDKVKDSQKTQIIIKSMVDMCHLIGVEVVAEGIEDNETHEIMKNLGVDYGQGYLYSKPLELKKLSALLNSNELSM